MRRDRRSPILILAFFLPWLAPLATRADETTAVPSAAQGFDQMKALVGDWVDADGSLGLKPGEVAVSYRLTGGGKVLIENQFSGTPHEMVTVYLRDGDALVATHYCAAGNQPHFRSKSISAREILLDFDGGTNLDPAKDTHIHSARIEFISPDEIRSDWMGWVGGKADPSHVAKFHLVRKKG